MKPDKLICDFLVATLMLSAGAGSMAVAKGKPTAKKPPAASAREKAICLSPRFVSAMAAYKANNYRKAVEDLNYVDAHGGCCEWTHYYLGLAYQGMNQVGLAYRHYEWVITKAKNPSLRKYAQYGADSVSYYAANRTYGGQGGIVAAVAESRSGGGGGGGGSFG